MSSTSPMARLKAQLIRDFDIRQVLRQHIADEHADEPDTLVIDELTLPLQDVRADLAAVNGMLHGYEIKSDRDTLARLPGQAEAYNRTFDTMTLVATRRHTDAARITIPSWWGIIEARGANGTIELHRRRRSRPNPSVTATAIVGLLWRGEVLDALEELNLAAGLRTKSRRILCCHLAQNISLNQLKVIVRTKLKSRENWRVAPSPFRDGDLSRFAAKSLRCQANRDWLLSQKSPRRQH